MPTATSNTGQPQLVDLLKEFGLTRNPFNDRTAEKTGPLDDVSLFVPSDLRNFSPSPTTYVFFGKRGSGKTTIRMMMQRAYEEENSLALGNKYFIVDLSCPAHLTARLRSFQNSLGGGMDTWDTVFSDSWTTSDFVDCILSVIATQLVLEMSDSHSPVHKDIGQPDLVERIKASNPRLLRYFLLLIHLYADVDAKTLARVRNLVNTRQPFSNLTIAIAGIVASSALLALRRSEVKLDSQMLDDVLDTTLSLPIPAVVASHPRISLGLAGVTGLTLAWYNQRYRRLQAYERAAKVKESIRVVKGAPIAQIAGLLNATFDRKDDSHTIRAVCTGISPFQKLDNVSALLKALGFESLVVFGDCFDEVSLLDPVVYPSAVKTFAREACRNDVLNFGRMHLFFPETRLALDLSTDKTLKEARFDRHFVRDLVWSRFQLEELAKRRFLAAQEPTQKTHSGAERQPCDFNDIFKNVKSEDLSSYLSKLSTPRELMIMMTEIFSRIESNPSGGVSAQDLEIATQKALEQTV
jgi:energy-coupling factor transporter ATP-binding protein EcfA2